MPTTGGSGNIFVVVLLPRHDVAYTTHLNEKEKERGRESEGERRKEEERRRDLFSCPLFLFLFPPFKK